MLVVRAFALLCCVFSLFVQVAAHAAAIPQPQAGGMNCAEMTQAMPRHQMRDQDEPSGQPGCCPDMTLGCLVAMHCLPTMVIAGLSAPEPAAPRFAPIYLPITADTLESQPLPPESPPPQASLTA